MPFLLSALAVAIIVANFSYTKSSKNTQPLILFHLKQCVRWVYYATCFRISHEGDDPCVIKLHQINTALKLQHNQLIRLQRHVMMTVIQLRIMYVMLNNDTKAGHQHQSAPYF